MNCDACGERLIEWLDGVRAPEVEGHLAGCGSCRGLFETARSTAETLRSAPVPEPRGRWEDVLRRMDRPRRRWWPAAAAAAAVAAAGLLAIPRRDEAPPKRLRIEVVEAGDRIEPGKADAVMDSLEDGTVADLGGPR
ncbi:MAG: hypothetical protein HYY17_15600 [Planctomycetes bacterium]|nr:hypothetical protein [Planctomycetota bacterium]